MAVSVLIREERIRVPRKADEAQVTAAWDRWRALLCQILGREKGMLLYSFYIQAWDALQARGCKAEVLGIRLSLHFRGVDKREVRLIKDTTAWAVNRLVDDGILLWWKSWSKQGQVTVALLIPTLEGTYKLERAYSCPRLAYRVCKAIEGRLGKTITRIYEREKAEAVAS